MTDAASPLAARLLAARRGATPEGGVDATLVPRDAASAMAVQAEVAHALREGLAGWKVGIGGDGAPFAAPLLGSAIHASPARLPLGSHLLIEMEIAVRLRRDLPPGRYRRDELLGAIDEVLVGIEVLRGRLGEPPAVPFLVFLADNGGNLAYVSGGGNRSFADLDLTTLPCRLAVDGGVVHEQAGGHPQGDPIEPIRAYLEHASDRLGGLRAGHLVTTGSLNKPVRLDRPAVIEAILPGLGSARLDVTA
jgi:2-keto-4-pentenoate hydratase